MFTKTETLRYSRHFVLPDVGEKGQQLIKSARVLCVGAGGLGSASLWYLAAAGVGTLGIIDNDEVSLSNLQRQILYVPNDDGKLKATIAAQRLKEFNPDIQINTYTERLTRNNALTIFKNYDVIVDGSDNFATRYLVNDACFHAKKPLVFASVLQFQGQCAVFTGNEGPCYRCLYEETPSEKIANCAEAGVLGALPGILGSIQATETLKLILKIGTPLNGKLLTIDALTMRFQQFTIKQNPNCKLCVARQPFATLEAPRMEECTMNQHTITPQQLHDQLERTDEIVLIDVREPYEHAQFNIGGNLIPLNQLPNRLTELDINKPIIVYCKVGERSRIAAEFLRQHDFNAINLAGGILGWLQAFPASSS